MIKSLRAFRAEKEKKTERKDEKGERKRVGEGRGAMARGAWRLSLGRGYLEKNSRYLKIHFGGVKFSARADKVLNLDRSTNRRGERLFVVENRKTGGETTREGRLHRRKKTVTTVEKHGNRERRGALELTTRKSSLSLSLSLPLSRPRSFCFSPALTRASRIYSHGEETSASRK